MGIVCIRLFIPCVYRVYNVYMKKLFNKTFFNFLLGFLVIIMFSFTMVSLVDKYRDAENSTPVEASAITE